MTVKWIETREVLVGALTKFPGNAKRGDVKSIRESIRKTGQYRAIVVRQTVEDLIILAGNHTFDAIVAEGFESVRCEIIECSDTDATRINLADNRLSELGTYDDDDLSVLLASLDGDLGGSGWDFEDLDKLTDADIPDEDEDAPVEEIYTVWGVVIECDSEADQVELLERFDGQGYKIRALM